jgi:hypothetical protein
VLALLLLAAQVSLLMLKYGQHVWGRILIRAVTINAMDNRQLAVGDDRPGTIDPRTAGLEAILM